MDIRPPPSRPPQDPTEVEDIGIPSPYAISCYHKGRPVRVFMTEEQYLRQLRRPNNLWVCPSCGETAWFDDTNYEFWMNKQEDQSPEDGFVVVELLVGLLIVATVVGLTMFAFVHGKSHGRLLREQAEKECLSKGMTEMQARMFPVVGIEVPTGSTDIKSVGEQMWTFQWNGHTWLIRHNNQGLDDIVKAD